MTGPDGVPTVNDDYRIQYMNDHLVQVREAIEDGVEVMVANSGYVLMARDMKYWKDVNEQLHQVMFAENRETVQNIEDGGMEMGRM